MHPASPVELCPRGSHPHPPPSRGYGRSTRFRSAWGATDLEAAPGFEPGNNGFAVRRLTTWLCRPIPWCLKENGAGNGTRTRDIHLGKVVLYQLSYSRPWIGSRRRPSDDAAEPNDPGSHGLRNSDREDGLRVRRGALYSSRVGRNVKTLIRFQVRPPWSRSTLRSSPGTARVPALDRRQRGRRNRRREP